jgi:hypothetical protein
MVKYEKDEDVEREAQVAKVVAAKWNWVLEKTPVFYKVDFLAFRDRTARAWIEVKARRTVSFDQYPHLWLSLQRVSAAMRLAEDTNLPAYVVFGLADGIYSHRLKVPMAYRIEMGGRHDRNDQNDYEPCCCLPLNEFSVIQKQEG